MNKDDIDKLKTVISKQDFQIKTLVKITSQLKNETGRLKLRIDQLEHILKRNS